MTILRAPLKTLIFFASEKNNSLRYKRLGALNGCQPKVNRGTLKNNLDTLKKIGTVNDYSFLTPALQKILDQYKYCARVMVGYKWNIEFFLPKKISHVESLRLKTGNDLVWWCPHYFQEIHGPIPVINFEGIKIDRNLKQDQWFYESTLKLVVVQTIKDEAGNYYGELELDFYKLDEYDTYFTPDGTPKLEPAQAFYDEQKKRYSEWLDKGK